MTNNNEIYTDDKDKANLLNDYFKSYSCLNNNGKEPLALPLHVPSDKNLLVSSCPLTTKS